MWRALLAEKKAQRGKGDQNAAQEEEKPFEERRVRVRRRRSPHPRVKKNSMEKQDMGVFLTLCIHFQNNAHLKCQV